jgi:hypothetical protein
MPGMYESWRIKESDVAFEPNRDYTCEERGIVRAAEQRISLRRVMIDYLYEILNGVFKNGIR